MRANFIGYILAGIGVIGIILSFDKAKEFLPFLQSIESNYILISAISLVVIGILVMLLFDREKARKEVPIYKGKKIVGYRRH